MPPVIQRLGDAKKELEGISVMSYGGPGSGKTHFAGTSGARTFYIDTGRSTVTLKSPNYRKTHPGVEDMILVEITEKFVPGTAMPEKALAFDDVVDCIGIALSKEYIDKWDTLVIDDATALRKFAMFKGMEIGQKLNTSKTWSKSKSEDMLIVEVQDYKQEMGLIEGFIAECIEVICKQAKKNFIMLAHQRQIFGKPAKIGDEGPLLQVVPGFTGKTFPDVIGGLFDWILYHECVGGGDNTIYRVRTSGDERLMAKVRHSGIFKTLEANPNFLSMLSRVNAAYGTK
jgi:hypothetical protein